MGYLSRRQIYDLNRRTGFPHRQAILFTAIALKESRGRTNAFNGVGRDQSYGLYQINMLGALGPARRARYRLTSNEELFDPAINARVAFDLWGGNDANLDRHWGIYQLPGRDDFRAQLARVERELGSAGALPPAGSGGALSLTEVLPPELLSDTALLASVGIIVFALVVL